MVGESRYPLLVDPKEEPFFREAGRMISRRLTAYRTKYNGVKQLLPEDMLAMVALDLAVTMQHNQAEAAEGVTSDEITQLTSDLQQFLDETPCPPQQ